MSPSSSGSWCGTRGADIIDLDRYMRGAVRPTRPLSQRSNCGPELVVDAGGTGGVVKPKADARHKRYSHDSGVSDSSYSRHRRVSRSHRRLSNVNGSRVRAAEQTLARIQDSSDSLRQFRTVCEQALLEQQRQIAHVAQLCEKLTERAEKSERGEQKERNEPNEWSEQKEAKSSQRDRICDLKDRQNHAEKDNERPTRPLRTSPLKCKAYVVKGDHQLHRKEMSSEISDISSSSRSTRDPRRKDKHRTQQCKTYKIIMTKLDELNRLFASRPPPAARPRSPPSSSSVTVCDKLVATDPPPLPPPPPPPPHAADNIITPSVKLKRIPVSPTPGSRRVTQAFAVDIAPVQVKPNVVTESVMKSAARGSSTSVGDVRCGFDLDDPVHLYSQAKKLQTLTVTSTRPRRRGRSVESRDCSASEGVASDLVRAGARDPRRATRARDLRPDARRLGSPSLCAVCRDYWRSLRHCLVPHMFSAPDHCQC